MNLKCRAYNLETVIVRSNGATILDLALMILTGHQYFRSS